MRRTRTSGPARKILTGIAIIGGTALFAVPALVLSTFPVRSGRLRVAGLRGSIRIETDRRGVPTIRAATFEDALFGLGWAHARDRLWQMELQRRVGSGRLAEALGPKLLSTDRFLRTVGFRRAAESAVSALSPAARRRLSAYRTGVNAYLASSMARPIETTVLRIRIEPFDDADCLVWSKLMAWDLAGNAAGEIRRAKLVARVGPERAAELLPVVPATPTILRDEEWQPPDPAAAPASAPRPRARARGRRVPSRAVWQSLEDAFSLASRLGFGGEAVGSNSWVVAGSRTRSGKPILANDPHLGLRTPSIWYLARLEAPGIAVEGATLPGLPGIVIGHNDRIAWGVTNLEPDVQDLYLERLDPKDPSRYLWKGQSLPFETRMEILRVRGAANVRLPVRTTVHGPVVTDVIAGADRLSAPVSLRWTGLDPADRTGEAFLTIDEARDWTTFLAGVALLHAPGQNFVYADVDGHIGYTASGAIPIRPRSDGLLPVSGAGEDDWTGFIPFERLPRTLDPARGYVVTANNRVVSDAYPWPLARDWSEPYRAHRIEDRILSTPRLTREDVRAIQLDRVSYQARDVLPLLLDTRPADRLSAAALARLRGWKGDFSPDSVPASIYAAWYAALSTMPEDELGEPAAPAVRSRFLIQSLAAESPWCDDVKTPRRETCAEFKSATLSRAVTLLRTRLGADQRNWRWDRLHRARFPHAAFDGVPVLSRLFSLETGQGGDASTVNVGAYRRDGSFRMTDGPSYREIIDLSDLPASLYVHTTGQSGNPFSAGYRNLLPMWKGGRYFTIGRDDDAKVLKLEAR
ncbi:MAG: penicillin acylase family protein [Acidobacteria bacterium]|nr:penicillin acylase family protein [Acidobacteriota bacterium]